MKTIRYWLVSGGTLPRQRRMKRETLTELALDDGFDGDSVNWIFDTATVVCYLRNQGFAIEYHEEEVEDADD